MTKGTTQGGACNVTACQKPGAEYWNTSTRAWYCEKCARAINAVPMSTPPLCVHATSLPPLMTDVADYEAALADKRRLTRELDVAMHGEAGAAQQASLCDLIEPARRLREENDRLREALHPHPGTLDTSPLILYFGNPVDRAQFIELFKEAKPGARTYEVPPARPKLVKWDCQNSPGVKVRPRCGLKTCKTCQLP